MAVKTTTTYVCDGCGESAKQGDLRRFTLAESTLTNPSRAVAEAKTDLCTNCEGKLHKVALPLWPEKEAEKLAGIVRG